MLSDWDIYKSHAANLAGIDAIAPLIGPGSLLLGTGANLGATHLLPKSPGTFTPVGVLRGAGALVVEVPSNFTVDTDATQWIGVCGVCTTRELLAGSTSYAWLLGARATGYVEMRLYYFVDGWPFAQSGGDGFSPSTRTLLWSQTLTPPIALGTTLTLELEWEVSAEYGGTRLIGRRGQATNYSDLVTLCDLLHPREPLPAASLGEGVGMIYGNGSINYTVRGDQWRLRA